MSKHSPMPGCDVPADMAVSLDFVDANAALLPPNGSKMVGEKKGNYRIGLRFAIGRNPEGKLLNEQVKVQALWDDNHTPALLPLIPETNRDFPNLELKLNDQVSFSNPEIRYLTEVKTNQVGGLIIEGILTDLTLNKEYDTTITVNWNIKPREK